MSLSKLTVLNALLPKDVARRAAAGIAYGPGGRRKLDVYVPTDAPRAAPVLVFFYGGSWAWGERGDYSFLGHAFAARGIVAVIPDYRVLPEVEYPCFLEDGAEAAQWATRHIAEFGGNPRSLFLAGHSSGAYNAAMLALDRRYLAQRGIADHVRGVVGLAGPYDFLPLDTKTTHRVFGKVDDLPATQPVNLVAPAGPPMFLATGAADRTVFPRNTHALARRLRDAGVPVIERSYPGIGHAGLLLALSRPFRHRAPVLGESAQFIAAHRQAHLPERSAAYPDLIPS